MSVSSGTGSPGGPGQRAVKRLLLLLCVCVVVVVTFYNGSISLQIRYNKIYYNFLRHRISEMLQYFRQSNSGRRWTI